MVAPEQCFLFVCSFVNEIMADNVKAIEGAKVVLVCVLPQYTNELLEEIKSHITDDHIIVSCVSGSRLFLPAMWYHFC